MRDQAWRQKARCRTEHPDIFDVDLLPEDTTRRHYAQRLCAPCPVQSECAYDALHYDTRGVVRGGFLFPNDAANARKARKQVAAMLGVPLPILRYETPMGDGLCGNELHPMLGENVMVKADGSRRCRECAALARAARRVRDVEAA